MEVFLVVSKQVPMHEEICIFIIFCLLMILFFFVMHPGNKITRRPLKKTTCAFVWTF